LNALRALKTNDPMSLSNLESLLADRPELLPAICDLIPGGAAWFDASGTLRAHNAALARLVGTPPPARAEEWRLRPVPGRGPSSPAAEPLQRALGGARIEGEDFEYSREDGAVRWVRLAATPVRDGAGKGTTAGVLVVLVDVAEAHGLDTIRQQVLGVVAHDLRNPLSALRMTASLLAKPNDMPMARRVQLAERMIGTVGRTEAMVSTLLEYARAEAGVAIRLAREQVDLGQLFERTKKELVLLFPDRPINERLAGPLTGWWDGSRLERVLANLLSNALKHGREDAPVEVVLDGTERAGVRIQVHNEGAPIPADLLPKIFEPFTIGPLGQDGRRRSVGLGLYIVKYLVGAHGGSVQVRSSAEDGTTFTVLLPREAGGEPPVEATR
jgi:PAS domain S-box-containing protein